MSGSLGMALSLGEVWEPEVIARPAKPLKIKESEYTDLEE